MEVCKYSWLTELLDIFKILTYKKTLIGLMEFENNIEMKNVIFEITNTKTNDIFFVTKEINGCIIWKTQEKTPWIYDYVFLKFWKGDSEKISIDHCEKICLDHR